MNKQIVQAFYAALKLPIPTEWVLEKDLSFADQLIAKYGPDEALANVKMVMRHLPKLKLRSPIKGLGSFIRLPWMVENAARWEAIAPTPTPKPEGGWTAKDWEAAAFYCCHPSEVAAKMGR